MPIYEYRCGECDEKFELFVRSTSQQATATCPKCGSQRVRKAISLFGVSGTGDSNKPTAVSCSSGPT